MWPRFEFWSFMVVVLHFIQDGPNGARHERRESDIPDILRPDFTLVHIEHQDIVFRLLQPASSTTWESVQMILLDILVRLLVNSSLLLHSGHPNTGTCSLSGTLSHQRSQCTG